VRWGVLLILAPLLVLADRAPESIVLPEPAQAKAPIPRFVPPPVDLTLVETDEMRGWTPVPLVVTAEEVRTDVWLWRRLFFRNWDRIGTPLREEGLAGMLARFHRPLRGPPVWDRMDADDWDLVPQPVRAMAVLGMIDCWQAHYLPGKDFAIARDTVRGRLHAVAMAESWFVHRAVNENEDGSRDLGIVQASAYARDRIRVLYIRGDSDFGLAEDDYFDPWKATRALVYWFSLMLDEAGGDLDTATRAYHVGGDRAQAGAGTDYLEGVERLESEYVLGPAPSPTWTWLRQRSVSPCPPPHLSRTSPGVPPRGPQR
jgi:Transglycosylase SLT domain